MWRDLFTFTKSERRGLIVMCFILLMLVLFSFFRDRIFPPKIVEIRIVPIEINHRLASINLHQPLHLSSFNPNTVDCLSLINMNIPLKIVNNIFSYRRAGGTFYKADDLQRLYAIDSAWMDSLRAVIDIPYTSNKSSAKPLKKVFTKPFSKPTKWKSKVDVKPIVELNLADTSQLRTISGIGVVYASRIVKYRTLLGGFFDYHQLKEVYGLRAETIDKITPFLTIDTTKIRKLCINKLWFYSLRKHPYCTKEQANAIIKFRKTDGVIDSWRELQTIKTDSGSWEKLRPYIDYSINRD